MAVVEDAVGLSYLDRELHPLKPFYLKRAQMKCGRSDSETCNNCLGLSEHII